MKKIYLLILAIAFGSTLNAQFCNMSGNLIIYSNYDGGTLTINVDQNIPNLKIGIISYEAVSVTFTGPFVGNITAVEWAGYNANNGHCNPNVPTTVINGVSASIVTQNFLPAATYSDPNGYSSIVCAYSCGSGNQGGCNTAIQISDYFLNSLGGSLYYHYLQYGCWNNTLNVSTGGNCCDQPASNNPPVANFNYSPSTGLCLNDCINFSDNSTNTPTTWSWTFSGGTPASSNSQNPTVCYNNPGTYSVSLTAQNAFGNDSYTTNIVINNVNTSVTLTGTTLTAFSSGATYQWLDCDNGNQAIPSANAQSFTPSQTGNYSLEITENGCTDTSGCVSVNINSIGENQFNQLVQIYPNPSSGILHLNLNDETLIGNMIIIENSIGQEIEHIKISGNRMTIDMRNNSTGIYFIKLITNEGIFAKKIILN